MPSVSPLLKRAFPDGIADGEYFALLWALDEAGLSIRSIARVVEENGLAPWAHAYNDVLLVLSRKEQFAEPGQVVLRKLEQAALLEWASSPLEP